MPYVICYASTEFVLKQQLSLQSTQWQETSEQEIKNQETSVFSLSKSMVNSKSNLEKSNLEEGSILFHQLESQSKQEGKTVSPYEKFVPPVFLKKIKETISTEIKTNHLFDRFLKMIKNSNSATSALFFPNKMLTKSFCL